MELVLRIHHSVEQSSIAAGEFVVDVQIADLPAIGEPGHIAVDPVDDRHERLESVWRARYPWKCFAKLAESVDWHPRPAIIGCMGISQQLFPPAHIADKSCGCLCQFPESVSAGWLGCFVPCPDRRNTGHFKCMAPTRD